MIAIESRNETVDGLGITLHFLVGPDLNPTMAEIQNAKADGL
jgi:hypothetical protein